MTDETKETWEDATYPPYRILASEDVEWLARQVNKAIARGWEPMGGIAASSFIEGARIRIVFAQSILYRGQSRDYSPVVFKYGE